MINKLLINMVICVKSGEWVANAQCHNIDYHSKLLLYRFLVSIQLYMKEVTSLVPFKLHQSGMILYLPHCLNLALISATRDVPVYI